MQCTGVRIQLKGIHFLALQKFQAFQGDNLVDLSLEDSNGLQLLRENSLMSVGGGNKFVHVHLYLYFFFY